MLHQHGWFYLNRVPIEDISTIQIHMQVFEVYGVFKSCTSLIKLIAEKLRYRETQKIIIGIVITTKTKIKIQFGFLPIKNRVTKFSGNGLGSIVNQGTEAKLQTKRQEFAITIELNFIGGSSKQIEGIGKTNAVVHQGQAHTYIGIFNGSMHI